MEHTYGTSGICSKRIDFELDEDTMKNITFEGGCSDNHKGVVMMSR